MEIDATAQPLPGAEGSTEGAPEAPQITNLDSLSEFEFQGEKYTPERLQEMFKGYQSLSAKEKSFQSEERFWSNLDMDLESVAQDPSLVEKFKRIYPQKFHTIVDRVIARNSQPQTQTQGTIPKEFLNEFGQLKSGYSRLQQQLEQLSIESANAKIESANAKLDAILPKLFDKFPLAVEDSVLARAEGFINQGGKMTDAVWERFAKESHEGVRKKADSHYKKELQTQLEKGQRSADIGSGGAPVGKAPVRPKTFDDAREAWLKHVKSQGL